MESYRGAKIVSRNTSRSVVGKIEVDAAAAKRRKDSGIALSQFMLKLEPG